MVVTWVGTAGGGRSKGVVRAVEAGHSRGLPGCGPCLRLHTRTGVSAHLKKHRLGLSSDFPVGLGAKIWHQCDDWVSPSGTPRLAYVKLKFK